MIVDRLLLQSAYKQKIGKAHPVSEIIYKIYQFFISQGFVVEIGNEIESFNNNFTALNVDNQAFITLSDSTFYLSDNILLRSHLSPLWIHLLRDKAMPIAVLEIGKVYRHDAKGGLFRPMFHQAEGVIIDNHVSFSDLKGLMYQFIKFFFGVDRKIYFFPYWHAFTAPGVTVEINCLCGNTIQCCLCQNKRIQICTAGMIDESIFKNLGIDSARLRGIAFGLGPTRIAQVLYNLEQIQWFYNNNIGQY